MSAIIKGISKSAAAINSVRAFSTSAEIFKTPLYNLHLDLQGKMVEFAGYYLPVQYPTGIFKEHMIVRGPETAGVFDVSHMGQLRWTGKDAAEFLEHVLVADVSALLPGHAKLSLILNEKGCILDDTVVTNAGDYIYQVVNGATKFTDMEHFKKEMEKFKAQGKDVNMEYMGDLGLIALQGHKAAETLRKYTEYDVTKMPFMTGQDIKVAGVPCRVTRCGYTGEDGYEISIPNKESVNITKTILNNPGISPCGLGARDSLRLEAGLCLYGNDMDDTISPVEATLMWTINKKRRAEGTFIGHDAVMEKMKTWEKKRVGFVLDGAIARHNTPIYNGQTQIGHITSGTKSPLTGKIIAMGYVNKGFEKEGTKVEVEVRGKRKSAVVTKMPFNPTNYYRG